MVAGAAPPRQGGGDPAAAAADGRAFPTERELEPYVNTASSLVVAGLLVLLGYAITRPVVALSQLPTRDGMPLAMGLILVGRDRERRLFLPPTRSPAAAAAPSCSSWSIRWSATSRSTTRSGRCAGTSIASPGPSSCSTRCRRRCGCCWTLPTRAPSRSPCTRTCWARPPTSRSASSRRAPGA